MRTYRRLMLSLAAVVLLTACATGVQPIEPTPSTNQPAIVEAVKAEIAKQLSLSPDQVKVTSIEPAEWPDGCLGLPAPGEVCIQIVVPGYGGIVEADGRQYEFRSNETGDLVRLIPDIALLVRQALMQQLHVDFKAVTIVAVEAVEWPDACLGVALPDVMCAQVITPGYRIILEVDGGRYEYHTDRNGGSLQLAAAPEADVPDTAIIWTQQAAIACQTAIIGSQDVAFGVCGGPSIVGKLLPELNRPDDLAYFVKTYASFAADTPAGSVKFTGRGARRATQAEQRLIAEWARLVYTEAAGGRSGASYGLILSWHREGGIAGFCDDLNLYVNGIAYAASCRGNSSADLGQIRPGADQLKQIFEWVDRFKGFEMEQSDSAAADQMTIRVVFSGAGATEASEADQQAIQQFAAKVFAAIGK